MAYAANQEPDGLTELTTLASGDVFVVGDISDANEAAKYITKANLLTDLGDETQTLTNKTIDGDNNTVSNLAIGAEVSATVGADLAMGGNNIDNAGVVFLTEQAAADVDVAGQLQLWAKTATPNQFWYTDDAGTDFQVASLAGTETLTNKTIDADNNTITNIGSSEITADIITGLTEQASPGSTDFFIMYDAGLAALRKVDYDNMPGAGGGISNVVEDTTPQLGGALDGQGFDLNNMGVLFLTEQAAAEVDVAGKGQLWVQTATPNLLMFTDDAGTDFQLATIAGTETLTNKTLTSPTLTTPVLGTPSSGNLGSCTAYPGDSSLTTVGTVTSGNVDAVVSAASATTAGKVELATIAETNTGTDTTRAVTPDGLSGATKSIMLSAAGGAPLTTAGCSEPTKVEAATNDINYWVLDFDASTEEHAFWNVPMPDNWDAGVVNATFYWTNAAGLTTETVDWGIAAGSWGDSDAIDAALGTEVTTTDTWLAQGDMHISSASGDITVANAAAGEWCSFVVARKVATDDLTGDARLIAVKIEYTIDAYSE